MTKPIAILLILAATHAQAVPYTGWDTNAWPASDYPFEGVARATDAYRATHERWVAVEAMYEGNPVETAVSAPSFYLSQRANLVECKTRLKSYAPYYINTGTTTNWVEWLDADTNRTAFPLFAATNCLVAAGLPTNYFEYTPYINLAGIGAWDITNASTAAGGSTFPAGRTVWYVSDYGWQGISNVCATLTATRNDRIWAPNEYANHLTATGGMWHTSSGQNNSWYGSGTGATWIAARGLAEIDWANDSGGNADFVYSGPFEWYEGVCTATTNSTNYQAIVFDTWFNWKMEMDSVTNLPTFQCELYAYHYEYLVNGWSSGDDDHHTFFTNTATLTSNAWAIAATDTHDLTNSGAIYVYSSAVGTGSKLQPTRVDEPPVTPTGITVRVKGWDMEGSSHNPDPDSAFNGKRVLPYINWTASTNGFQYK